MHLITIGWFDEWTSLKKMDKWNFQGTNDWTAFNCTTTQWETKQKKNRFRYHDNNYCIWKCMDFFHGKCSVNIVQCPLKYAHWPTIKRAHIHTIYVATIAMSNGCWHVWMWNDARHMATFKGNNIVKFTYFICLDS